MAKLNMNSISDRVFEVNAADMDAQRADVVAMGRLLAYEYAVRGNNALAVAEHRENSKLESRLNNTQYRELNEKFQQEHFVYAAKIACQSTGAVPPADFAAFKRQGQNWYGNAALYNVLSGIYQQIVTPILPAVYSTAVDRFAEVIEVGFGESAVVSVGSNDIPVFQDSAWGASRSVPRNRFYSKDISLVPTPRTAQINAKWMQLIGNGYDFGRFFANITAGLYAKTMGLWNAQMTAAASDPTLIPSGLTYAFSDVNWATLANKIAAVNNTRIPNLMATGSYVALSKVLPTQATGSVNVDMDAALAMLLGRDYISQGYLGNFLGVRLLPMDDAVVPGTQNSGVTTILSANTIWMMAANGRKPLTIAYNRDTPITIEFDPTKTADFEIGINMTIALDSAAVFSSKIGLVTI